MVLAVGCCGRRHVAGRRDNGSRAPGSASIVRLENVQKYFGAIHALRDINIAVGRNETVGLIGDNGAGKSTLIKVMTGVIAPTSGRMSHPRPRDRSGRLFGPHGA